jgi:hypothetical protein
MARNNHVKTMRNYIEKIMFKNQCIITHKTILKETNANCCYSVLKGLRNYYDIEERWIEKENCRFKEYTFKRKEVKQNAQSINIRRECEACQLSLI